MQHQRLSTGPNKRDVLAPVHRQRSTEAPVQRTEILKGYEIGNDEFVVLEPAEVAALRPRTSSELEITEFVRVEDIDHDTTRCARVNRY